jgi:tRNA-dihydrouridine synthase 3
MPFLDRLPRAVVMAPMTKGSNLPYRQLCVELGAVITASEMTVARRLKQKRRGEFALIRRFEGEPCFGVQLAGTNPDEMAWAAALAISRGSEFVDVNLGCPIDYFTRKGLGAALGRQPSRVARIVSAMRAAVDPIPVTVKIRLGWNDRSRNYMDLARAAVDAGAAALTVHGRTRDARYRHAAEWDVIGEIAAALPVPVIGNGDLLFGHEVVSTLDRSGCAAVMVARGALIRPWLFREAGEGYRPLDGEERVSIYRRYVALALAHWGDDEHGRTRAREFLLWHLGFWCRESPQRADGTWPTMQEREPVRGDLPPLERVLRRGDAAAHEWLADRLMNDDEILPHEAPPPGSIQDARIEVEAEG